MGVIEYVILAAVTTATIAWFKFFYSTLVLAKLHEVDNSFTRSPFISGFVFFTLSLLISPLLVLPVIVPKVEASFKKGMEQVIMAPGA